jgi:hypothetical protein
MGFYLIASQAALAPANSPYPSSTSSEPTPQPGPVVIVAEVGNSAPDPLIPV